MNISSITESNSSSLAERYRMGDSSVGELFGGHPSKEESWIKRASLLDRTAGSRANSAKVAEALRAYQEKLPYFPEAAKSLERLEQDNSLVIVGGQQAGLFGGALLIFYKALSVIQTARQAEKVLGRPVVPLFWIAGEDHDFDEANHVNIQSAEGGIRRIRVERPEGPRLAVSRTALTAEQWQSALQDLAAQLPDSEYKQGLLDQLRTHVEDAPTLSLAFARLLAQWFGSQGLVLLDADDPSLRALEGPMFQQLIDRNDELETALKEGEQQVSRLGFKLQAETAAGSANVFLHHEQGRLLLYKDGDSFVDRKGHVALTRQDMQQLTARHPDRLSTNALTRPLMQDYLLPVLGAVLGPSELAYWGILGPAFIQFDLSMPILVPRQSFTYVESSIANLLDKYRLSAEEAMSEWAQRKSDWLSKQDEWKIDQQFELAKQQFLELYSPIMATVSSVQPGLAALAAANRDKIIEQMNYLESRSIDAIAKRHEASLRQWDRMYLSLSPLDKPQERVYGTIHFLNRYGSDWLNLWNGVPYDGIGGHRLVEGLTN